jgi:hypothetical protein
MAARLLLATSLLLVLPRLAHADAPSLRWSYSRGPGAEACPDAPALRRAITEQLGRDPFGGDGDDTVLLDVRRAHSQLRARIELMDRDGAVLGARELRGESCVELAPALTLAVALAIDALAAAAPPPAAAPAPLRDAAVTQADDDEVPTIARDPPPRPTWEASLGVVAALDATLLAAAGLTLQADLLRPSFSIGIELRGDLPATTRMGYPTVTAALVSGTVVPCLRHRFASLCGLVSLGAELASVADLPLIMVTTGTMSMHSFWAGLGGRLAVELPLYKRLAMRLHADVIAPVTRNRLTVPGSDGTITYYLTPAVSSALGLAVLTIFP